MATSRTRDGPESIHPTTDEERLIARPVLSVKFLRANGLLWPDHSATLKLKNEWTKLNDCSVEWDADAGRLKITYQGWLGGRHSAETPYPIETLLDIEVVKIKEGRRSDTYFVDPLSGRHVSILFFLDGRFGTRESFGIKYLSQRLTPAQRREWDLQNPGTRGKWYKPRDPLVVGTAPGSPPAGRPNKRHLRYSTAHDLAGLQALDVDRQALVRHRLSVATQNAREDWYRPYLLAGPGPADHLEVGIWEEQPLLELGVLAKAGFLVSGEQRFFAAAFNHQRADIGYCYGCVDLTAADRPLLALLQSSFLDTDRAATLHILRIAPITARQDHRHFLICPVTGDEKVTLAYRAGSWGSMGALRLVNASQRSKKYCERIARANVDAPRLPGR